jgi:2,3,4,5-tetrahydropyridine-2-carboxylate N-succinyltransferase
VRIVPGGSSVRTGAYLARSVIMMPPAYVNIGAYVDEGTMIDSHALVGSCAQVGKHVHLSAASQLGGVLEPVGALPVIIEDNVFIGGNCGIYEGTIVKENAVIGTGVIINASTAIFDATTGEYICANENGQMVVPAGAVVVAGSRPISKGAGAEQGIHLYCPVIVKYRDDKIAGSITLEDMLR